MIHLSVRAAEQSDKHPRNTFLYECERNLVEERAVCDRKSQSVEAHSQHHVIWSVVAVALTAAVKKTDHSLPAEHHPE